MFRSEAELGGAAGSGGHRRGHWVPRKSIGFLRVNRGLEVLEVHPQLGLQEGQWRGPQEGTLEDGHWAVNFSPNTEKPLPTGQ